MVDAGSPRFQKGPANGVGPRPCTRRVDDGRGPDFCKRGGVPMRSCGLVCDADPELPYADFVRLKRHIAEEPPHCCTFLLGKAAGSLWIRCRSLGKSVPEGDAGQGVSAAHNQNTERCCYFNMDCDLKRQNTDQQREVPRKW